MTERMAKLDRVLTLVHALAETCDGLTLDEMANLLVVNRRTAERLRNVVASHFELDEWQEDRRKRFRIRDSLRRVYTRPNAAEVSALQAETEARRQEKAPHADLLESLLAKVKGAMDDRERRRLDPDLEALARLQRSRVSAGPDVVAERHALATVQGAIMAGTCLAFNYIPDGAQKPKSRKVVPYGLIHGPITYLIGKLTDRDAPPVRFRLDRMQGVRQVNEVGGPPDDWDLDEWLSHSFGVWREEKHEIVLRVRPEGVSKARQWRFHPDQQVVEDGDELVVRFSAGGLRELAEHLFIWGGGVIIESPDALREVMQERLQAARGSLRPKLSVLCHNERT